MDLNTSIEVGGLAVVLVDSLICIRVFTNSIGEAIKDCTAPDTPPATKCAHKALFPGEP